MYDIPKPQTLDPERPLRSRGTNFTDDDRPATELLHIALKESCAYAEQLWDVLNRQRAYLLASLPPDPRSPDAVRQIGASPTGPEDAPGWDRWISAFATATSALCGPQGDSGFGLSRARHEAELRRNVPAYPLAPADARRGLEPLVSRDSCATTNAAGSSDVGAAAKMLRAGVIAAAGLAAIRGLMPRRK